MSVAADLRCSRDGCISIRQPGSDLCAQHRLLERRGAGLCPNCGGERERLPCVNLLTGRQLLRGAERLPVWQWQCTECGYSGRAQAGEA